MEKDDDSKRARSEEAAMMSTEYPVAYATSSQLEDNRLEVSEENLISLYYMWAPG